MDANEAEQIQQRADNLVRLLIGGKPEALEAACALRSRLDYLIREMTLASIAQTPLERAVDDLARIVALKAERGASETQPRSGGEYCAHSQRRRR
jgi:hypothetical protein